MELPHTAPVDHGRDSEHQYHGEHLGRHLHQCGRQTDEEEGRSTADGAAGIDGGGDAEGGAEEEGGGG